MSVIQRACHSVGDGVDALLDCGRAVSAGVASGENAARTLAAVEPKVVVVHRKVLLTVDSAIYLYHV